MIDPPRGYGRDGHGRFFTDTTQTTMTKLLNLTHATTFRTLGPAYETETPWAPRTSQNVAYAALYVGYLSVVRLLRGAGLAPACGARPQQWRLRLRPRPARSGRQI